MNPAVPPAFDIVLVGGGHSHVAVLKRFGMKPQPGVRVTLVARDVETPYSGMLPGYLAGHYERRECHLDLARLAAFAGARLILAAADGLDLDGRTVRVAGRPPVPFDLLSLDIGSTPDVSAVEGAAEHALAVKPVDRFLDGWAGAERRVLAAGGRHPVVVVGGGAGGVELALSLRRRLAALLAERGEPADGLDIAVVSDAAVPLPRHAPAVQRRMDRLMAERGVRFLGGRRAGRVEPDAVVTVGGERIPAATTVMATHAGAAAWLRDTGLELDGRGFVAVDGCLRSLSHPFVFAVGDIASFGPRPLEKSGVYAVRQGPVLADSLRRLATGRPARRYVPQRRTLALVSSGDRHAIASWGPLALEGDWVWRAKDHIDRRWMRKYRELPAMAEATADGAAAPMRCGGCGAKVASAILARALAQLRPAGGEGVLIGLDAADDAAAIRPPPGQILVQTVDQFRAFLDDPWMFGRIAANHCLGDLHAMGARPHSALALVTLPFGPEAKLEADLAALLGGALSVLDAEGVALVGGHTGEGAELAFGLSLNGFAAEEGLWRKAGAKPGDRLVLTKALGTGVLFAGHMRHETEGPWLEAALAAMQCSSRSAAACLRAHGATACTDVTGFGLAGHLVEMMNAGDTCAELDAAALPLLPGAADLLARGRESTLAPSNRAFEAMVEPGRPVPAILFDPQTAGGLLAAVPADRVAACLDDLYRGGDAAAAVIGTVVAADRGGFRIRLPGLASG